MRFRNVYRTLAFGRRRASDGLHRLAYRSMRRGRLTFLRTSITGCLFTFHFSRPIVRGRLFEDLRSFRFVDGSQFDLAGDRYRSGNARGRTLSDSNERVWKGFAPLSISSGIILGVDCVSFGLAAG